VTDAQGHRLLNSAGWKYLLKSCPGLPVDEARALDLFSSLALSTQGSGKPSKPALSFDEFLRALEAVAREAFPADGGIGGPKGLLRLIAAHLLPAHGEDEDVVAALAPATQGDDVSGADVIAANTHFTSDSALLFNIVTVSPVREPSTRPDNTDEVSMKLSAPLIVSILPAAQNASPGFDSPPSLKDVLSAARLDAFAAACVALGADSAADLRELSDADLDAMGMRELHKRRLREAAARACDGRSLSMFPVSEASSPDMPVADCHRSNFVPELLATVSSATSASPPSQSFSPKITDEAQVASSQFDSQSAESAFFSPPISPSVPNPLSARSVYEWEEFATPEGFLYYVRPQTGETSWKRPPAEVSVHTFVAREQEKRNIANEVELKMLQALQFVEKGFIVPDVPGFYAGESLQEISSKPPLSVHFEDSIFSPAATPQLSHSSAAIYRETAIERTGDLQPPRTQASSREEAWRKAWIEVLRRDESELTRAQEGTLPDQGSHQHNSGPLNCAPTTMSSSRSRTSMLSSAVRDAADAKDEDALLEEVFAAGASLPFESVTSIEEQPPSSAALALIDSLDNQLHTRGGSYHALTPSHATPYNHAATTLARRRAAAVTFRGNTSSAPDSYADVFELMPMMDAATMNIIARSHSIANRRVMGYADPRPDVRPVSRFGAHADHGAARLSIVGARGAGGRSFAEHAGSLREGLYAPVPSSAAARFGTHGSVAPSAAVSGYAFRHAAAVSRWAGQGSVLDRLTDSRGYTGAHKHRFDADGRGRGID
jgi:hypothetical protein